MEGDESSAHLHGTAKEVPWLRTFLTQAALCFFLFVAFNIGQPQIKVPLSSAPGLGEERSFGSSTEFYFVSVAGGSRPLELQSRLLKQMGMIAKIYKPNFVLNIGQFGEVDPLWFNVTLHPELSKIPWYTTTASKGRGIGNFMKKIQLPYEQVLEVIGIDTGPFQNAYLSTNGCSSYFYNDRGTTYIENPRPTDRLQSSFFLHGVSPQEIKTYSVDYGGIVELKNSISQQGREAI
ncbi:calcineurin-like metallo-phosphoesterase superfamily protein isoform X4 [Carex rostrata]